MLNKTILATYNVRDALVVISTFPKRNETYSEGVCAMASFTRNVVEPLVKDYPNRPIIVFAPQVPGEQALTDTYPLLVVRCFSRNHPLSFLSLMQHMLMFHKVSLYLTSFEFASFGDTLTTLTFLFPLWFLFLLRKKTTLLLHQVVTDIATLSTHIGIQKKQTRKVFFLNTCLYWYYHLLLLPQRQTIVLEKSLEEKLKRIAPYQSVTVIPHSVIQTETMNQQRARSLLHLPQDEHIVLFFGYLTWYKGVDFLAKAFQNSVFLHGKPVRLVIAGGPSFTQAHKKHYQQFFHFFKRIIAASPHTIFTGFISEEQMPLYFSAADIVVLPYRTHMSSPGPLSLALSFHKPFLLSRQMEPLLMNTDAKQVLQELHLQPHDLLFSLTKKSLLSTLEHALQQPIYEKLTQLSTRLAAVRTNTLLAPAYASLLYPEERPVVALDIKSDYV